MTALYVKKRRERCVLFLDDCFDKDEAPDKLRHAGFFQVEPFITHFKREDGVSKEQGVKDPRIIRLCNSKGWLLVTTDSHMLSHHASVIIECPDVAILASAHNTDTDIDEWVNALIKGKARIEREFKKMPRPWYRQGKITTIMTVTPESVCVRSSDRETMRTQKTDSLRNRL